jgi:pimeloyl-ACP methyl ester carboxylesterase
MERIELSTGGLEYHDTGGEGPCVVLLHGVLMNETVWREVVNRLRAEFRCVVPTLPLGSHREALDEEADLSNEGLTRMLAEFIESLDLHDVTLVLNDWGGAQLIVEQRLHERIGGIVLVACEAFHNFPPGAAGRQLGRLARLPGGLFALAQLTRFAFVRRQIADALVLRPPPPDDLAAWFEPLRVNAAVRRDLRRFIRTVPLNQERNWSGGLVDFDRPALVVWAEDDVMMPAEHGPRLAELLPQGKLVTVQDSRTVISLDQPGVLAEHLRGFVIESVAPSRAL